MEQMIPWPHYSATDRTRHAAELLEDVVNAFRNRGHTREHALVMAARELALNIRRARALLYDEPVVVLDQEIAAIRAAFLRHLDAEAEHLAARSAAARERLRRITDGSA